MNEEEAVSESNMLYHELHSIVKRWMDEGEYLTSFGIVGALEAVKADVLEAMSKREDRNDL